jgi:PAS domain S-box-containing protein
MNRFNNFPPPVPSGNSPLPEMPFLPFDLLEHVSDAVLFVDTNYQIQFWNEASTKIYGYSRQEVMGRNIWEITRAELPEGTLQNALKTLFREGIWKEATTHRRKDGTPLQVMSTIRLCRNAQGEITGAIALMTDFTRIWQAENERKYTEERFKALVQNSLDIIAILKADGSRSYISPAAETILARSQAELASRNIFEDIHPEDLAMVFSSFARILEEPETPVFGCIRYRHAQGDYVSLDCVATNRLTEPGIEGIIVNARDVTQRKRSEEKVLRNEAKLKALMQNSPDVMVILDAEGKRIYVSPSVEKVLGYKAEMLLDKPATDFIYPADIDQAHGNLQQILQHPGKVMRFEIRFRHANGHYLWLECIVTNLLQDPEVNGIVLNNWDITERKEAEEEIRRSEERYKSLVQNSSDVILLLQPDGSRSYVSPSFETIFGRRLQETLGKIVFEEVHPEDRELAIRVFSDLLAEPEKSVTVSVRVQHAEGHYLYMECVATNLLADENVQAVVVNARDITERIRSQEIIRQSEQRLQAMIRHASDFITIIRPDGTRSYISDSVETILKISPDSLINKSVFENIHPEDVEEVKNLFFYSIRHPDQPIRTSFRTRHPDSQQWMCLESLGSNLINEPSIQGIIMTSRDVTRQRETENELKTVLEELKKRNFELDQYVYKVSHDLRAPLCSILGLTELIVLEEDNPESVQRYNDLIRLSTQKMDTYIRAVLSHSKVINVEMQVSRIDFHRIIQACMQEMSYMPNTSHITLTTTLETDEPFFSDEFRVTTLFKNFISNAIKYLNPQTEPNRLHIDVKISSRQAVIQFTDNGLGIDKAYQQKIFEMFFRANEKSDGSGLGLYIVRQTLEKLSGTVEVESEPGKGTRFTLTLPNLA